HAPQHMQAGRFWSHAAASAARVAPRAVAIELVDVSFAALDRDPAFDGLRIAVALVDKQGLRLAADATLSVELVGDLRPWDAARPQWRSLQRWSQRLSEADFDIEGCAIVTLPWRSFNPYTSPRVPPSAWLKVRMGVQGSGAYEATAPVTLAPWSPALVRF
ncbi:MAG: hypothetical protein KDA61_16285, partial [Planctomycetales bacterium]|nr:hypothetical protein [Planctomycetales bacterium]